MSIKVFFSWVFKSVFQGGAIMLLAMMMFQDRLMHVVAITFTALVMSELLNVASEIHRWHPLMIASEIVTVVVYGYSVLILRQFFNKDFIWSWDFVSRSFILTVTSWVPAHSWKLFQRWCRPTQHVKLQEMDKTPTGMALFNRF